MAEATSQLSILVKLRDEASAAMSRLSNEVSDLGGSLNFAGAKAGILAGALAAVAGAAILGGIKAFADAEVQAARFEVIIKNLPVHLQKYREQILAAADDALKFGFDNETAAVAIARLFSATGNANLSFQAFQAAMDLARFKGIGLEEAAQALILAFQGNARILKQFGIEVDEHASKETILAAVLSKVGGTAAEYNKTLTGLWEQTKVIGGEIMEAFGKPFAEALKLILSWVLNWINAQGGVNKILEEHKTIILLVAGALTGVLVVAFGVAAVAAVSAAAAWIGLTGAMILVGAVIGIFAAVIISNWNRIRETAINVANIISSVWHSVWNGISNVVSSTVNTVVNMIDRIVNAVEKLKNLVKTGAASGFSAAQNTALNIVNRLLSFLPFQEGGIVTRPTLGLIGEAGAEAVIPLNRLGAVGGLGGNIVVNLQGDFYTDTETAERFANKIAKIIKFQLNI